MSDSVLDAIDIATRRYIALNSKPLIDNIFQYNPIWNIRDNIQLEEIDPFEQWVRETRKEAGIDDVED